MAVLSARDAWAVGGTPSGLPLILHWTGARWTRSATPAGGGQLAAVAVSLRGARGGGGNGVHALILHWAGQRWARVSVPRLGAEGGLLSGVSITGGTAWAVGSAITSTGTTPVILRWTGRRWVRAASPQVAGGAAASVAATTARSAFAVGTIITRGGDQPLIERWDGRSWRRAQGTGRGILFGLAATSARSAWAVGTGGTARKPSLRSCAGTAPPGSRRPSASRRFMSTDDPQ